MIDNSRKAGGAYEDIMGRHKKKDGPLGCRDRACGTVGGSGDFVFWKMGPGSGKVYPGLRPNLRRMAGRADLELLLSGRREEGGGRESWFWRRY